jgi:hypothetical protein
MAMNLLESAVYFAIQSHLGEPYDDQTRESMSNMIKTLSPGPYSIDWEWDDAQSIPKMIPIFNDSPECIIWILRHL